MRDVPSATFSLSDLLALASIAGLSLVASALASWWIVTALIAAADWL